MVTITKSQTGSTIWETIYDRLVANVTNVTLADATTQTVQVYTSTFPDTKSTSKASYPMIVVDPVDLSWNNFTLTKKEVRGTFTIIVYTTKSEATEKLLDSVINSIETYRTTLNGLGLTFVNLENTQFDNADRGSFKIHLGTCSFSFRYKFTKTWP